MPSVYVRLLIDAATEYGLLTEACLEGSGLVPLDLVEPGAEIIYRQQRQIYENVAEKCDVPGLGLKYTNKILAHVHGVYGYAMQTSRNIREALMIFVRFYSLVGPLTDLAFILDGKTARFVINNVFSRKKAESIILEELMGGMHCSIKELSGRMVVPLRVAFSSDEPANRDIYDEFFGCEVSFGSEFSEYHIDAGVLDYPVIYSTTDADKTLAEKECQKLLLRKGGARGFADGVLKILGDLPVDKRNLEDMSHVLCISPRTLRRRLQKEGTSFNVIYTDFRRAIAMDLLRFSDMSVEQIGYDLGFHDAANFRTAFKNWAGKTPSQFRAGKKRHCHIKSASDAEALSG